MPEEHRRPTQNHRPESAHASAHAVDPDPRAIRRSLDRCLAADRRRLARRLRGIDKPNRKRSGGRPTPGPERRAQILREIASQAERSIERRAKRAASVPKIAYPDDLPIAQRRDEIARAIDRHQVVVVCGETGSGKTTQLPKICLELGRGIDGAIGHTQPRRIAARSVADRVAEELGVRHGGVVGSKVRFGDKTGPDTLVKLMTDGILLAETQGDRLLDAYDTIIVDEAHERSLNIDFLLGYLATILPERPDLKLIITSATIDPERFAEHFAGPEGPAPIINVSGRAYPVEVRYRPPLREAELSREPEAAGSHQRDESDTIGAVLDALEEIHTEPYAAGRASDVLIFMPGEREIRETAAAVRRVFASDPGLEVLPLYARLSSAEQRRVFAPHRGRRVVIATNVAETSLTVPGIGYVIDPGTARVSRYSARSKVQGLPIEPISQASANQRKGRCGRVGPGVCYRLYSEEDFHSRDEFTQPEIMRTSLASVVLQMAALGLGRPEDFPFVEPPDRRMIRDGYDTLLELGAVTDDHRLTEIGARLARLPVDPRTGRMILAAHDENRLAEVLVIASGLTIQDPRERPADRRDEADAAHERFSVPGSDFLSYLELWHFYHDSIRPLSRSKRARACRANFISDRRMHEWAELQRQLREVCAELGMTTQPIRRESQESHDAIHRALLAGLLTSVGRKTDSHEYEGVRGTRFAIHPGSALFARTPPWIVSAELVRTTRLYARCNAAIKPEWIERAAPHLVKTSHTNPRYAPRGAKVVADEKVALLGLEIVPKRTVNFGPIDPPAARRLFIHHALVEGEYGGPGGREPECLRHNRELIDSVRALEDKARRRDLLAEAEAIHAFYDDRLPGDCWSGDRFEKARKALEARDPRALRMTAADALADDPGELRAEDFPDTVRIDRTDARVEYTYNPGAERDGATLELPAEAVARLDARTAERLVPGWLPETVAALMRTLPKRTRRHFDINATAAELAPVIRDDPRPVRTALAEALASRSGLRIAPDDLRDEELPEHLRVNIRAVDARGKVLAESRDLAEVQARVNAARSDDRGPRAPDETGWHRDGLIDWEFGELPESIVDERGGRATTWHPALVDTDPDTGRGVGLRLLDTAEAAERSTRLGVSRLFAHRLRRELKWRPDREPGFDRLAVQFSPLGEPSVLASHLSSLVARALCLEDQPLVRTSEEFERRIDTAWDRLGAVAPELFALVDQILTGAHALRARLERPAPDAWRPALADVNDQIGRLMRTRFIVETPLRWLRCYPRFLRAAEQRLDRLRGSDVSRDRRAQAELRVWISKFDERTASARARGVTDPGLDEFGWLLEEYRVALFAQNLRTSVPVSRKRLESSWAALRG